MVLSVSVVDPHDHIADCRGPGESVLLHIASLGREQNSNFEIWFLLNVYRFHTIVKSKNCNSNQYKLGPSIFGN